MFGKLMPKEGKYFDHFNNHAALIAKGGQLLTELISALASQSGEVARIAEEIEEPHSLRADQRKIFVQELENDLQPMPF